MLGEGSTSRLTPIRKGSSLDWLVSTVTLIRKELSLNHEYLVESGSCEKTELGQS